MQTFLSFCLGVDYYKLKHTHTHMNRVVLYVVLGGGGGGGAGEGCVSKIANVFQQPTTTPQMYLMGYGTATARGDIWTGYNEYCCAI